MSHAHLPRLLDSQLKELDRLHPLRLSLTLNLSPLSTATMELPPGQEVKLRQMVELFTPHGSAGVFRVATVQSSFGKCQRVTLAHGLCTLSDAMLAGSGEATGTAKDALQAILAAQTTWILGTCETTDEALTWRWDNSNALEALTDLMTELPGHYLAFDQSTLPWKLHVLKLSDADACECTLHRGMTGITIKEDDSTLCTRLIVPGLDAPLDADTIDTWGVIARTLDADLDLPRDMLLRAARAHLEDNKNPRLTITIDAVELARRTGDPFDRFTCGKMCRTRLDHGAPIRQRLVQLHYADVIGTPELSKITLASTANTASTAIAGLVVDTTVLINRVAGNSQKIKLQGDEITLLGQEIALKATQALVDGLGARLNEVSIELDATEAELLLKASAAELTDTQTQLNEAVFRLDGQESLIEAQAKEIALKADLITLDAYVKVTELEANYAKLTQLDSVTADVANLASGLTTAQALRADWLYGTNGVFTYLQADAFTHGGALVSQRSITMGSITSVGKALSTGGELDLQHSHAIIVNDDGTITLGEVSAEGGNFKIADTKAYKDGVSAAYGNGYNGGFADGKDAYLPTAITRTGYDTAAKTVTVRALNTHQDLLTGQVIDAAPIYDHGYSEGDAAGYTRGHGAGYTGGWNACLAEAKSYGNWTGMCQISQYAPSTLYARNSDGTYYSVGSSWVTVHSISGTFYKLPAAIA